MCECGLRDGRTQAVSPTGEEKLLSNMDEFENNFHKSERRKKKINVFKK